MNSNPTDECQTRRTQEQLLEHYRDLQATLFALSNDYRAMDLDLPYDICLTKTFYAEAHDGTPLKATLSLTLVDLQSNP